MILPSPVSYDMRWTTQLIRRDVKNLKAKYKSRLRSHWPRTVNVDDSLCQKGIEPTQTLQSNLSQEAGGIYEPWPVTIYEDLQALHKQRYAPRDVGRSADTHYRYRGSWLLLHMAIQNRPANPAFHIFRNRSEIPDNSRLLLELIKHSLANAASPPTTTEANATPVELNTKRSSAHIRIDSQFSESTSSFSNVPITPILPGLWRSILEGVGDEDKTIEAAESLLSHIWPNQDARETLGLIGAIDKRLSEAEEKRLRDRLRTLLLPESETFGKTQPIERVAQGLSLQREVISSGSGRHRPCPAHCRQETRKWRSRATWHMDGICTVHTVV